jgi:hypothetical protein
MRIDKKLANVHERWRDSTATVYSCGVDGSIEGLFSKRHLGDLLLMRAFTWSTRYLIVFSYVVNGTYFSGEFISSTEMSEGSTFPIRYDPRSPAKNDSNDFSAGWAVLGHLALAFSVLLMGHYLKSHR